MEEMNKSITDAYYQVYAEKSIAECPKGTAVYLESLMTCIEPSVDENGYTSINSVYDNMLIEGLEQEYVSSHKTIEEAYSETINTEVTQKEIPHFVDWYLDQK